MVRRTRRSSGCSPPSSISRGAGSRSGPAPRAERRSSRSTASTRPPSGRAGRGSMYDRDLAPAPCRRASGAIGSVVRARGSHPRGHWFESSIAHHSSGADPHPSPRWSARLVGRVHLSTLPPRLPGRLALGTAEHPRDPSRSGRRLALGTPEPARSLLGPTPVAERPRDPGRFGRRLALRTPEPARSLSDPAPVDDRPRSTSP